MEPRAFSGPGLAPPINDTAETATIPGDAAGGSDVALMEANLIEAGSHTPAQEAWERCGGRDGS